jgi:hypothetical protein
MMIKTGLNVLFLMSLVACTSENKYNSMSSSLVDPSDAVVSEKVAFGVQKLFLSN